MDLVVILVVVAVIIAIEVPLMWRRKLIKEMWVFSFLLLFGTFLGIINALNIPVPNPLGWMIFIYNPVADMVSSWLS